VSSGANSLTPVTSSNTCCSKSVPTLPPHPAQRISGLITSWCSSFGMSSLATSCEGFIFNAGNLENIVIKRRSIWFFQRQRNACDQPAVTERVALLANARFSPSVKRLKKLFAVESSLGVVPSIGGEDFRTGPAPVARRIRPPLDAAYRPWRRCRPRQKCWRRSGSANGD